MEDGKRPVSVGASMAAGAPTRRGPSCCSTRRTRARRSSGRRHWSTSRRRFSISSAFQRTAWTAVRCCRPTHSASALSSLREARGGAPRGGGVMGSTDAAAHDPSVADSALSHEVRKCRRATSPASHREEKNRRRYSIQLDAGALDEVLPALHLGADIGHEGLRRAPAPAMTPSPARRLLISGLFSTASSSAFMPAARSPAGMPLGPIMPCQG